MPDDILVSVILPAYNVADHIQDALGRLQAQTYERFEVIVVDDCSTDGTIAAVSRFDDDKRISLIPLPANGGVANARNIGLASASGEYVWFVDADDEWSPDFIKTMLLAARNNAADVAVCSAKYSYGPELSRSESVVKYRRSNVYSDARAAKCIVHGTGALWNKLFRRESLGEAPFPALRSKSDHAGLLGILPNLRRVAVVPTVLYTYVQRDGSISNGGVAQPKNFLALLPIAARSFERLTTGRQTRRLQSQFRCMVVSRALRETWRYSSAREDDTQGLIRLIRWRDIARCSPRDIRTLGTCVAAKLTPRGARNLFRRAGRSRWSTSGLVAN